MREESAPQRASSAEGSGRAALAASHARWTRGYSRSSVIVGYGLFRGVNASSYLSAFASLEAPFLFVPDLFFNVVVACSVVVCSVTVIALVLRLGGWEPLSMPYGARGCSWRRTCAPCSAFSRGCRPIWRSSCRALLLGVASVMLSLVWVEVLACQGPRAIVTQIALSMLVNMVTSSVLSGLSGGARAVTKLRGPGRHGAVRAVRAARAACWVRRAPGSGGRWRWEKARRAIGRDAPPPLDRTATRSWS